MVAPARGFLGNNLSHTRTYPVGREKCCDVMRLKPRLFNVCHLKKTAKRKKRKKTNTFGNA